MFYLRPAFSLCPLAWPSYMCLTSFFVFVSLYALVLSTCICPLWHVYPPVFVDPLRVYVFIFLYILALFMLVYLPRDSVCPPIIPSSFECEPDTFFPKFVLNGQLLLTYSPGSFMSCLIPDNLTSNAPVDEGGSQSGPYSIVNAPINRTSHSDYGSRNRSSLLASSPGVTSRTALANARTESFTGT